MSGAVKCPECGEQLNLHRIEQPPVAVGRHGKYSGAIQCLTCAHNWDETFLAQPTINNPTPNVTRSHTYE